MITKKILLIIVILLILFGAQYNSLKSFSVKNKFMIIIFEVPLEYKHYDKLQWEIMEVIFNDNFLIYITSYQRSAVVVNWLRLKIMLGKLGYEFKDIKSILHNHFTNPEFSKSDIGFLNSLIKRGFKGKFKLYYKGTINEFSY